MKPSCGFVGSGFDQAAHQEECSSRRWGEFFHENCYYEEKPSMSEAMPRTCDPGLPQLHLGKTEFLKLRNDYRAQKEKIFCA